MIIGITGDAGAGKDTLAKFILSSNPDFVGTAAFGDKVKENLSSITDLPLAFFYDRELKENLLPMPWSGFTARSLMQRYATEIRRNVDPHFWIRALVTSLKVTDNFIVTDVRFKNEADFVIKSGGYLVKIVRDNMSKIKENAHISETTDLTKYIHMRIQNNGTLEDLTLVAKNLPSLLKNTFSTCKSNYSWKQPGFFISLDRDEL